MNIYLRVKCHLRSLRSNRLASNNTDCVTRIDNAVQVLHVHNTLECLLAQCASNTCFLVLEQFVRIAVLVLQISISSSSYLLRDDMILPSSKPERKPQKHFRNVHQADIWLEPGLLRLSCQSS
jgi:hypothetical protein